MRLNSGSSSRKEENPIRVSKNRPILGLKVSVQKVDSVRGARNLYPRPLRGPTRNGRGVACDMLDQALEVFRGIQEYFLVNPLPPVCASSCSGDHVTVNKCGARSWTHTQIFIEHSPTVVNNGGKEFPCLNIRFTFVVTNALANIPWASTYTLTTGRTISRASEMFSMEEPCLRRFRR